MKSLTPYITTHPATLNVLEYLIRRYEVHIREPFELLTCMLPHHESAAFHRALQLVNVAELPSYFFLRPYAAQGASAVPRSIIARQAGKEDTVILKCVLGLAETAAQVHLKDGDGTNVKEGTQRVIAFAAAVCVAAVENQCRSSPNSTLHDLTVRAILPVIAAAVGEKDVSTKCSDFRNFGYVLIASLSKHCSLGSATVEIISAAIVRGALKADEQVRACM